MPYRGMATTNSGEEAMPAVRSVKAKAVFPREVRHSESQNVTADLNLRRAAPTPRKLRVIGRDASVRLEQEQWDDLDRICHEIGMTINELARRIEARCHGHCGLTAGLREFVLSYWRSAATRPQDDAVTRVQSVLLGLGGSPQGQFSTMVLRIQDRIAPHLTPGRVRMMADLPALDLGMLGAQARERWGGEAPWEKGEDFIAAQVLRNLVSPAAVAAVA